MLERDHHTADRRLATARLAHEPERLSLARIDSDTSVTALTVPILRWTRAPDVTANSFTTWSTRTRSGAVASASVRARWRARPISSTLILKSAAMATASGRLAMVSGSTST